MRKNILLLLMLIVTVASYAQPYHEVDSIVGKYPRAFWSPEKLAARIRTDFHSDSAKARAAFAWMTKHVAYDVHKYTLIKKRQYQDRIRKSIRPFSQTVYTRRVALATIRKKKGVCGDYSILYARLCELLDIECEVITGVGKTTVSEIGRLPRTIDHGWNAVRINNRWRLIDVTWGAGGIDLRSGRFKFSFDDDYFFTPPELFFLKHFPRDKKWLMVEETDSSFARLPLYHRLEKDIRILSPSGLINNNSRRGIEFAISAGREIEWTYSYSKDRFTCRRFADISIEGNVHRFIIPPPSHSEDFLTIYCDGLAFATFKVRSRNFIRVPFAGRRMLDVAQR